MNSKKVNTLLCFPIQICVICLAGTHGRAGDSRGSLLPQKEYPARDWHCSATGQMWNLK